MMRSFFPAPTFEAPNDPAVTPWYTGKADEATVGYFIARGWDKDPAVAAIEASKAHREAEKKLGIPSNEVVRFPTKADDPAWAQVWQRLGVGKTAEEYDLSKVMIGDKPLDPALASTLQKLAHALNLPKDKAPMLAAEIAKLDVNKSSTADADRAAKLEVDRAALKDNWKSNYEANKLIARNAAAAAGLDPEIVNALENVAGYAKTMEALRNIGVKMGEDKFIRNDLKPGGGVMSKQEAISAKRELMADAAFSERYRKGDVQATRQMMDLMKIEAGVA